jgi:hypothetical protein
MIAATTFDLALVFAALAALGGAAATLAEVFLQQRSRSAARRAMHWESLLRRQNRRHAGVPDVHDSFEHFLQTPLSGFADRRDAGDDLVAFARYWALGRRQEPEGSED